MTFVPKSKLPRLAPEFYRGTAVVLWTHTLEKRTQGWLNEAFHHRFRELLLHAAHRYALACPCYVLMPDHWHLVWMGLADGSDQRVATAFLRKHLQAKLGEIRLQDRAHDHVLRESERTRSGFQKMCAYVLANPERAGLCEDRRGWRYLGTIVAGYPVLDPREPDFWTEFWKIHNRLVDPAAVRPVPRSQPDLEEGEGRGPCAPAQGYTEAGESGSPPREGRDPFGKALT